MTGDDKEPAVIAERLQAVDDKLDALKADHGRELGEIKQQTTRTNSRVGKLERGLAMVKGGLIVVSALAPFAATVAVRLLG